MAAMLNTSLKTYCRIAIASTSGQIDPGKCARTCWTPDGCALSEPIWDETFTLSYKGATTHPIPHDALPETLRWYVVLEKVWPTVCCVLVML